jgi:uncharacterized protein GlcG (DUF336 family)
MKARPCHLQLRLASDGKAIAAIFVCGAQSERDGQIAGAGARFSR